MSMEPTLRLPLVPRARLLDAGRSAHWPLDHNGMVRAFLQAPAGHFTMSSLARASGISRKAIWCILHGWSRPSLETGVRLARVLGVSPQHLLDYSLRIRNTERPQYGRRVLRRKSEWPLRLRRRRAKVLGTHDSEAEPA